MEKGNIEEGGKGNYRGVKDRTGREDREDEAAVETGIPTSCSWEKRGMSGWAFLSNTELLILLLPPSPSALTPAASIVSRVFANVWGKPFHYLHP